MIVISDTSPLNYLILLGVVDILPKLFGQVHAPPAVIQELRHPRSPKLVKNGQSHLLIGCTSPRLPWKR